MTVLWGLEIQLAGFAEKREKIEKVTGSQDDGLVGVLKSILVPALPGWADVWQPALRAWTSIPSQISIVPY
jgi:hypothetical protein